VDQIASTKTPCPDEERLVDYIKGRLSEKEHFRLEEHLAICDICLDGLMVASNLMLDKGSFELKPVPETVTETAVIRVSDKMTTWSVPFMVSLKRFVKRTGTYMFDFFGIKPLAGFQFSQIRGSKIAVSEDFVCLKVPFAKVETTIEIEKTKNATAHIRVKAVTPVGEAMALRVTLKKGEREVASYILNDAVAFEHMPFDHYNISLFLDGESLGTYFFKIKETRHGIR
jgi:hypothetical protein